MLSSSYTLSDVKLKLSNVYSYYGYTAESQFNKDLRSVADDVKRLYFIPRIGETEYDRIYDKNRAGLTYNETNIYWAEIFAICFEYLRWKNSVAGQMLSTTGDETLTVEGYTYRTSAGSGSSSKADSAIWSYRNQMYVYFKLAGFDISAIERTCTIFGDSPFGTDVVGIIE